MRTSKANNFCGQNEGSLSSLPGISCLISDGKPVTHRWLNYKVDGSIASCHPVNVIFFNLLWGKSEIKCVKILFIRLYHRSNMYFQKKVKSCSICLSYLTDTQTYCKIIKNSKVHKQADQNCTQNKRRVVIALVSPISACNSPWCYIGPIGPLIKNICSP